MYDYYRVAAAVPSVKVANVNYNKEQIISKLDTALELEASIVVFPELSLTGYTCQDLFFQSKLMVDVNNAIMEIAEHTNGKKGIAIVGAPAKLNGELFNAAYVISAGIIYGITLKTHIPNMNEFYEKRWFSSAADIDTKLVSLSELSFEVDQDNDYMVMVGNNVIYNVIKEFKFGIEICEDLWAPIPPSSLLSLAGAEIIINLSASNETISKREYRKGLVKQNSASNICDYIYVSAGASESTQDLIFSGHSLVCEYGSVINENKDFIGDDYIMVADIDLEKIRKERIKNKTFKDTSAYFKQMLKEMKDVYIPAGVTFDCDGKYYRYAKHPFIPSKQDQRLKRCNDIFDMQVSGLVKRLEVTGCKPVIGVSGGMDSTLALLVAAKALKKLGRPSTDLIAITMPAFGTTNRTFNNSLSLMENLGATCLTINIKDACVQHLKDLGRDESIKDITYENTQARERTQILMDYANMINGLVVGTGDLSELALGWCTYNGDQMSMYGVNASIPKTLVKWMIDSVIQNEIFPSCTEALTDIIATPISPELLPPDENGNIAQKTEDNVGPYELHDFFLYYVMRFGFSPKKIFYMAEKAFKNNYDRDTILKWMKMFYRRFFNQQFKRSCMPDGVKVGSVCLSPRGDWRMPSDASSEEYLKELDSL